MLSPEMDLVEQARQRIVDQVEGFHTVMAALEVAALADQEPQPPALLVAPVAVRIGDSSDTVYVEGAPQPHDITITVHTVVAAPNDYGGGATRDEAGPLLYAVRRALTTWTPRGWRERILYAGGRLVSLDNARLEWADDFRGRAWLAYQPDSC